MERRFETRMVKLSDIKIDPTNPNEMNSRKVDALAESIERFGYVQEVVVDKRTMLVADGEHRLLQLRKAGVEEAEVKVYDFKDDTERKLFRQVANKVHGEHDIMKDAVEIRQLSSDFGVEAVALMTGDSEQDIIKLLSALEGNIPKEPTVNETDKLYHQEVECPNCHYKFKKTGA